MLVAKAVSSSTKATKEVHVIQGWLLKTLKDIWDHVLGFATLALVVFIGQIIVLVFGPDLEMKLLRSVATWLGNEWRFDEVLALVQKEKE